MRIVFLILLLATLGFSSCDSNTSNANRSLANSNANVPNFTPPEKIKATENPDPHFKSCNPYFPLIPGSQAEYTLQYSSPLVADVTIIVSQIEENGRKLFLEKTQIVDKSGGLYKDELTERKYACDNGRVQLLSEEVNNRTDKSVSKVTTQYRDVAVYIVDPAALLKKGTTWSYNFTQQLQMGTDPPMTTDAATVSFEAAGEEEIKVPAGTFKTIKVIRKIKSTVVYDYYAAGIGLVKRANLEGTTWELKSYSGLQPK
ncbi:MAG: hypothetical protein HY231_19595 [Acidobacteria bacterium]|nr:hypothetical protein [Acidobacteriota bacterium]